MEGIYAYSTYPTAYSPNPFTLVWDDLMQYPGSSDPSGNSLDSASCKSLNITMPRDFLPVLTRPLTLPDDASWFIDIVSPEVTSDADWQNMKRLSVKIRNNLPAIKVQFLLNVTRKSDSVQIWLREENYAADGVFYDLRRSS